MLIKKLKILIKKIKPINESKLLRLLLRNFRIYRGRTELGNVGSFNAVSDRRVLFATLTGGNMAGIRLEISLAAHIQRNFLYKPLFMLCDGVLGACLQSDIHWDVDERSFANSGPPKSHCKACFRTAAKTLTDAKLDFINLSELINRDEIEKIRNEFQNKTLLELKKFDHEHYENANSGTLRFYATGESRDKYYEVIFRRYYVASLIAGIATKKVLEKFDIVRSIVHLGIYVPHGAVISVLKKFKKTFYTWHAGYRKKTFMFAMNDTYHKTMVSESYGIWGNFKFDEIKKKQIDQYLKSRITGSNDWINFNKNPEINSANIARQLNIKMGRPVALLLTNVIWDAQLHFDGNYYSSMLDLLFDSIEYFKNNKEYDLIIRIHPAEISGTLPTRQKVLDEIKKRYPLGLPKNIKVIGPENPVSTYILANFASVAIVYATKAGFELAAQGLMTICAGDGWLRGKGFSLDVSNKKELYTALDKLPQYQSLNEQQRSLAKRYAYYFFFQRMIEIDVFDYTNSSPPYILKKVKHYELLSLIDSDPGLRHVANKILAGEDVVNL